MCSVATSLRVRIIKFAKIRDEWIVKTRGKIGLMMHSPFQNLRVGAFAARSSPSDERYSRKRVTPDSCSGGTTNGR